MNTSLASNDLRLSIRWYIFVRLLFLFALSVPSIITQYFTEGWSASIQRDLIIFSIGIVVNYIFYFLAKVSSRLPYLQALTRILIIIDITLITALIYTKGGIESRSAILYALPILVSAAIFGRKASYVAALAGASAYVGLITADYLNIIPSIIVFDGALHQDFSYVIQSISFITSTLFILALAADFMTKLLHKKQLQATKHYANLVTAQEIAKLGSWEWDIASDHITWSKELYKLFGIHPHAIDLKYDTYLKLIHPDDAPILHKKISQSVKKKVPFATDHRIVMADNTIKYVRSMGRPQLDSSGAVVKLAGTAQDVTEMHVLDIAKRDFISLASHQLRTPASGVKAFLSLLLDNRAGELTKKQREFVSKANDSNNRQLEIIDALLDLASIQSGKITLQKRKVDLRTMLSRSLVHHRPNLKQKKQRLVVNKPKEAVPINADTTHIQMAIDNLTSNAIKYTPERGKITITIYTTKNHAHLEVADTGIGIAKHDIPLLFQKFNRLNNPASGTVSGSGLGLYLAQAIVQLHNGKITVHSRLGEGARFTIKLPLSRAKQ